MNYIGSLASNGYDFIKSAVSQAIPDNNSATGTIAGKVTEVAKGVLYGVAPHVVSMSPMYLSRMTNMRFCSMAGLLAGMNLEVLGLVIKPNPSWLDAATVLGLVAINTIGMADLLGFTPSEPEYRIAVDSLLLLATAIGSSRAVFKGMRRMVSSWNEKGISTTSKVSNFVSGAVLTAVGTVGMSSVFTRGFWLGKALGSSPDKFALKHRNYGSLEPKECNAVIFDGLYAGKDLQSLTPFPIGEALYENCNTVTYDVENSIKFCDALADAKTRLGAIDVLSIQAHSNNEVQLFNNGYTFSATTYETSCIKNALSSDAQVFLVGCNTATPTLDGGLTITEKVSKSLPGKEVTGFSGYYNPFLTSTSFSNGRFQHESYFPLSLHGITFPKTAVVQKS